MSRLPCVLAIGLSTALAACGGGSSGHATGTTPPETTAATGQAPAQPAATGADWPTYHRDLARAGYDARAPRATRLRRAWSASVDGDVYAEPLVVRGRVIVATENNSLYAFSAGS